MKKQLLYLPDYKWHIEVFYDVTKDNLPEVMGALEDIDCPRESLERSYRNIASGRANGGLTYSNSRLQESVMVIGYSSTLSQFLDTATHENHHICAHIAQHYGLDPWGEPVAYLAGDIAQKMHPLLEPFMCSCKQHKH